MIGKGGCYAYINSRLVKSELHGLCIGLRVQAGGSSLVRSLGKPCQSLWYVNRYADRSAKGLIYLKQGVTLPAKKPSANGLKTFEICFSFPIKRKIL